GHAMQAKVPFSMETVFSYWEEQPDGSVHSKLDLIRDMQMAGYFVLLLFVGLTNVELSILLVQTRVAKHGHGVEEKRLRRRFPKTQRAIREAKDNRRHDLHRQQQRFERGVYGVPRPIRRGAAVRPAGRYQ